MTVPDIPMVVYFSPGIGFEAGGRRYGADAYRSSAVCRRCDHVFRAVNDPDMSRVHAWGAAHLASHLQDVPWDDLLLAELEAHSPEPPAVVIADETRREVAATTPKLRGYRPRWVAGWVAESPRSAIVLLAVTAAFTGALWVTGVWPAAAVCLGLSAWLGGCLSWALDELDDDVKRRR